MDKPGVQGCFLPQENCTCCGAGPHNGNEHDFDCITNLPGPFARLYPFWQQGQEDWEKLGRLPAVAPMRESDEFESYIMGFNLAKKKQLADRTAQSPEQAVRLLREHFRRDAMIAGKA